MDQNEIDRLALMGAALRPDWPARSLRTFFVNNLADRTYGDTAVALAWICTRTTTQTPRLLLESGAWWKAANIEGTTAPRPPRNDEVCPRHAGSYADNCSGCRADQLAGDETLPPNLRKPDAANMLALVRAEYAQVAANLCRHKIDRQRTTCADCDADEKRATKKPAPIEEPA